MLACSLAKETDSHCEGLAVLELVDKGSAGSQQRASLTLIPRSRSNPLSHETAEKLKLMQRCGLNHIQGGQHLQRSG